MNEEEFSRFLDQLTEFNGDQLEQMFKTLHEHFRYRTKNDMENLKIAWRCKQAMQLIQHRKK